jgi:hypothetical protein
MSLEAFEYQPLRGGFLLIKIVISAEPLHDAIGRVALARTTIVGPNISIELSASALSPDEVSVSIYHEVLEAATVGALTPPATVCELNEAGFEAAAQAAHRVFGAATPETLNRMLDSFGF